MKPDENVEKALALAEGIAMHFRQEYVSSEHLLLALCGNKIFDNYLASIGCSSLRLERLLVEHFAKETNSFSFDKSAIPLPPKGNTELQQSIALRRILTTAENIALENQDASNSSTITPIHIARAILDDYDSNASRLIITAGFQDPADNIYHSRRANRNRIDSTFDYHDVFPDDSAFYRRRSSDGNNSRKWTELYCTDLVQEFSRGNIDPMIGRVDEIERAIQVLLRRRKNNPIFVGEPGVGKTAIAFGLAERIATGNIPAKFRDATIYSVDLPGMLAGSKYRGDFEERLKGTLDEITQEDNAFIFIDEIHTIWSAGATVERTMDAANILKPYLSSGKIRCIGATTYEDFRATIKKDKALDRRFQKIDVPEPTVSQTIQILKGLQKYYEEFHEVSFTEEALQTAAKLASRHITEPANPDKAIDVIDEAGSLHAAFPERFQSNQIDEDEIRSVVSKIARIPNLNIVADETSKLRSLDEDLRKVVYGQNKAVKKVVEAVRLGRAGLKRPDSPVCNFLFAGPTGVGKTELAKQLAAVLGVEFIRFDMSEYSEKAAVSRLIGADPGYIGFEQGGQLTNAIIKHPHAVLLLDEIEKAHPNIFNILLQVMDAARLTDNAGHEANFRNVILIMTSNAGTRSFDSTRVGFDRNSEHSWDVRQLNNTFSPEFRNRLDAIIEFSPLTREVVISIVEKFIHDMEFQLAEKGVTFHLTDEVKNHLAEKGYDMQFGARPLDRVIRDEVKIPIADEILFGKLANGGTVHLQLKKGKITFDIESKKTPHPPASEPS